MLIINADDFGINRVATGNILTCFENRRITSTSAMVFMEDSERAAKLGGECALDVGLHVNFTAGFTGRVPSGKLREYSQRIAAFLSMGKYRFMIYNPALRNEFEYVYNAQYEEFVRLYSRIPTHIDGHHHMHLCMNMLVDKFIPAGMKVRRNYSLSPGNSNPFKRGYRKVVDAWLKRRYRCTDFFLSILPLDQPDRLRWIVELAKSSDVEIEVHPENREEQDFLMRENYLYLAQHCMEISS